MSKSEKAQKRIVVLPQRLADSSKFGSNSNPDAEHFLPAIKTTTALRVVEDVVDLSPTEFERSDFFGPDAKFDPKGFEREELRNSLNQIARILRDPKLVARYLRDLDEEVGRRVPNLADENPLEYLIAGKDIFLAGAWREDYVPLKKDSALDKILLERERASGLNFEGVATFTSFVDHKTANRFSAEGNIFKEDERANSKMLFHGKYSHRLAFEIIRRAIEAGDLELPQGMDIKGLLGYITSTEATITDGKGQRFTESIWGMMLDGWIDISAKAESVGDTDYKKFSYSCTAPDSFRSLILCFGEDIGLKNLQRYFADGDIKRRLKMVARVRKEFEDTTQLDKYSDQQIADCCQMLMTASGKSADIGFSKEFFFLPSAKSLIEEGQERFKDFPGYEGTNIKLKKPESSIAGEEKDYGSITEYLRKEMEKLPPKTAASEPQGRSMLSRIFGCFK